MPGRDNELVPPPDLREAVLVAGMRMREERKRRGWSERDLAERVGVDQSTVSKYERGTRFPAEPVRQRIEQAFGWEAGRVIRLAGMADQPRTLEECLRTRPLSDEDRELVLALVAHLEARHRK